MLQSMTGYGDATVQFPGGNVCVEIRSVNNRYLKVSAHIPDSLGSCDAQIEEVVRQYLNRGMVNVAVRVNKDCSAESFQLNMAVLNMYREKLTPWINTIPGASLEQGWDKLLSLPGVVQEVDEVDDSVAYWPYVEQGLEGALQKMVNMRVVEGQKMAEDLLKNREDLISCLEQIIQQAPRVIEIFTERLTERLTRLLEQYDIKVHSSDILREIGIYADKCDISEEIARLKSHLEQFHNILLNESCPGRKLDFLTQELFRETNTIGSKANDVEITHQVLAMKSAIERIREQVQNIE